PSRESWEWLESELEMLMGYDEVAVLSGRASGADSFGESMAAYFGKRGCTLELFPADWQQHGKAAGHIRNQQILDSGVDIAFQFPGGRGTEDMIRRLDKAGVKVVEYSA